MLFAEFINLISSESNEVCSREEKRTIAPEHVLKALEVFDPFLYLSIAFFQPPRKCCAIIQFTWMPTILWFAFGYYIICSSSVICCSFLFYRELLHHSVCFERFLMLHAFIRLISTSFIALRLLIPIFILFLFSWIVT